MSRVCQLMSGLVRMKLPTWNFLNPSVDGVGYLTCVVHRKGRYRKRGAHGAVLSSYLFFCNPHPRVCLERNIDRLPPVCAPTGDRIRSLLVYR